MRHCYLASIVIAALVIETPAIAQTWVAIGPPGGSVRSLASDPRDPSRLYLGTADGILYRSDDAGFHWQRQSPGFPRRGCSLDEIVVGEGGEVFIGFWEVGGHGGGVARSDDGGRTFTFLKGVDGQSVRALALAPSDPSVIAAGTLSGVFVSDNGGRVWKRITPRRDPALRNIESVAFDPQDPRILYVGTWHLGWKTLDQGATWMPIHHGMLDDSDVMTLTVDPRNPQIVYATACTGVYRSMRAGLEWTPFRGIPEASRRTRAFSLADDDGLLLAGTTRGLWISRDDGGTWQCVTQPGLVVNAVLLQPNGDILLGTEDAGVLRSADGGQTWAASNTGFSERFVSTMLFDGRGRRLLIAVRAAGLEGGVFASSGARGSWIRWGEGLEGRQVSSLALLDGTVFAGTDDGVFSRSPEATRWARLPTSARNVEARLSVSKIVARPPGGLLAATSKGLLHSTNGGQTWTQPALANGAEIFDLIELGSEKAVIVAATSQGFYRSRDGGSHWSFLSAPIQGAAPHALACVPSNDRDLFVATSRGLFRSDDQGVTWARVAGGIPQSDITGIAIHPDGRTLFASDFTWGGVFRSTDQGLTWKRMTVTGLASDRVWTLDFEPAAPHRLWASASAGGLHVAETP